MRKKGENTKAGEKGKLAAPILFGTGVSLVLFFLLALAAAGLLWSGSLSFQRAGMAMAICAFLGAFAGGRAAIGKGSGAPFPTGIGTGAASAVGMLLICLAAGGELAVRSQLAGVVLMDLAGGCLAALMGRSKKRRKKRP